MAFVLTNKNNRDQCVVLATERMTIGRDASNDLVVADERVSGFHCSLFYQNGTVEVVDLGSSNGTFVNGEWLNGRRKLDVWDVIRLGDSEFELVDTERRRATREQPAQPANAEAMKEPEAPQQDESLARTISHKEPPAGVGEGIQSANEAMASEFGQLLLIDGDDTMPIRLSVRAFETIGRGLNNTHRLALPTISTEHARISFEDNRAWLEDLNSSNGTYVNDERIRGRVEIYDGDVLKFDVVSYRAILPTAQRSTEEQTKTKVRPAVSENPAVQLTKVRPAVPSSEESGTEPAVREMSEPSSIVQRNRSGNSFTSGPKGHGLDYWQWLFVSWSGTATRAAFWKGLLVVSVLHSALQLTVASLIYRDITIGVSAYNLAAAGVFGPLQVTYILLFSLLLGVFYYVMVCVSYKRLRDRGRPPEFARALPALGLAYMAIAPHPDQQSFSGISAFLMVPVSILMLWFFIEVAFLKGKAKQPSS